MDGTDGWTDRRLHSIIVGPEREGRMIIVCMILTRDVANVTAKNSFASLGVASGVASHWSRDGVEPAGTDAC